MKWTMWTSCSSTCGPRSTRKRSRSFIAGRHLGDHKPPGDTEQVEYCSQSKNLTIPHPSCPTDARHGQWGEWSSCATTCYPELSFPPTVERTKECIPAILSDDADVNLNVITCGQLEEAKQTKFCEIPPCPGIRFTKKHKALSIKSTIPCLLHQMLLGSGSLARRFRNLENIYRIVRLTEKWFLA